MVTSQVIFFSIMAFITTVSLILIIKGHLDDNENVYIAGYIIIAIGIVFGFGAIGALSTPIGKTQSVDNSKYEIIKTERSILIETNNRIYRFREKMDFDNITDTTSFYLDTRHNFYGYIDSSKDKFYYLKEGIKHYGNIH